LNGTLRELASRSGSKKSESQTLGFDFPEHQKRVSSCLTPRHSSDGVRKLGESSGRIVGQLFQVAAPNPRTRVTFLSPSIELPADSAMQHGLNDQPLAAPIFFGAGRPLSAPGFSPFPPKPPSERKFVINGRSDRVSSRSGGSN